MSKSVNEKLRDHAVNHQIDIQRYGNGAVQRMLAILNRADKKIEAELVSALVGLPKESFKVQRLNSLLKSVKDLNGKAYSDLSIGINDDLLKFTMSESDYQRDLFDDVMPFPVKIASVDPEQVYAAAMARPFQISKDKAVPLNEYLAGLEKGRADAIRDSIRLGYINGQSIDQMVRAIRGTKTQNYADGLMEGSRRHVEGMVRTAVNHTSNFTQQRFYEANAELVKGVQWLSTLDGKTSIVCASRDGKIYPVNSGPRPPAHINACLKGTKITTISGLVKIEDVKVGDLVLTHLNRWRKVTTVMARPHEGNAVTLIDNFGRSVRLTNEHPVITRNKGWVEAGQIKVGDIFFNNIKKFEGFHRIGKSSFIPQAVLLDAHNIKTDLTDELVSYGIFSSATGMSSSVNLDNSVVVNNEIRVKAEDSILCGIRNANGVEDRGEKLFVSGWFFLKNNCKRISGFIDSFLRERRIISAHSGRAGSRAFSRQVRNQFSPMLSSLFKAKEFGVVLARFGSIFGVNAKRFAFFSDGVIGQSILSFDTPQTLAVLPVLASNKGDDFILGHDSWYASTCTRIAEYYYSDYVYNLSVEDDETYVADGFLVHNCRSTTVAVLKSWRDLGVDMDEFKSTRASMDGQVPEDITFQKWLGNQSVERQNEVLGLTRAKLFRGGESIDKFVDNKGKTYSINDLRQRNKEVFSKLGL